ncbi:M56 family metallopeptidase [Maribellus sediminis]|uniref:M56 family metallopeptidase n=1 Tax=Maribellus sediminis TaxID=2696285 RepID=UPI00143090CC|nr:M56 family metallopeptidase [Maribellus sediminis]
MNHAINFLVESGISLAVFSLIYILFLRKETFFRLNRIFLLVSVAFSMLLPFLHLKVYEPKSFLLSEVTVTPYRNLLEAVTIYGQDLSGNVVHQISSSRLIILVYLLGLLFFMLKFIMRISQIQKLVRKNEIRRVGNVKFVLIDVEFSPFSFLNYIFINPEKRNEEGYEKIIEHELEHIRQGHTFDVVILEVLTMLQWFNPFMWILKRVIRENHEFLADKAVLDSGVTTTQYKKLLLNQVVGFDVQLANNFNSSLVKKRIKMFSKMKSSKLANLKYVAGALSFVVLVIIFACEQKETIETAPTVTEKVVLSIEGKQLTITGDEIMGVLKDLLSAKDYRIDTTSDDGITYVSAEKNAETDVMISRILPDNAEVFYVVDEMPEFPGGDAALRKYIVGVVKYPELAHENGIQGKVFVNFVVTKSGNIANTKIAKGVDPILDKEALRVINSLPVWKPGKQNGQAVNVSYTVPINFTLN